MSDIQREPKNITEVITQQNEFCIRKIRSFLINPDLMATEFEDAGSAVPSAKLLESSSGRFS